MKVYDKILLRQSQGRTAVLSRNEVNQLFAIRTLFTRIYLDMLDIARTHPNLEKYDVMGEIHAVMMAMGIDFLNGEDFETWKARIDKDSSDLSKKISKVVGLPLVPINVDE